MSSIDFFRCEICGNIVALIRKGGGTLSCCGQNMTKLAANSTDGAKEKHVPVVKRENGKIEVTVGSTLHPMIEEHHIEWIALVCDDSVVIKYLKLGDKPQAEFDDAKSGTAYAYCNLHGLWKTEF